MNANGNVRIGVYICHCGVNIAQTVDVEAVRDFAERQPGVAVARDYRFMCSDPGQEMIREDINHFGLNRVVVAACSPQMHELTFRKACENGGLNRYLFQMANIREQCSWIHDHRDAATVKAMALVGAAIRRVAWHQPLVPRVESMNPNTLVVGAGIAGIQAALELSEGEAKFISSNGSPPSAGRWPSSTRPFRRSTALRAFSRRRWCRSPIARTST